MLQVIAGEDELYLRLKQRDRVVLAGMQAALTGGGEGYGSAAFGLRDSWHRSWMASSGRCSASSSGFRVYRLAFRVVGFGVQGA